MGPLFVRHIKTIGLTLIITLVFMFYVSPTLAYSPTSSDINITWGVMDRLTNVLKDRGRSTQEMRKIEVKLGTLYTRYQSDETLGYTFGILRDYIGALATDLEDNDYFAAEGAFINTYAPATMRAQGAQKTDLIRCFEHYPLVDHVSRSMNMPAAFIMATWYMETSCRTTNPANGDGLFQIINNHYEVGELDLAGVAAQLYDFKGFVENKFRRYNSKQDIPVILAHDNFNKHTLQTFAALYNGIAGPFSAYPLGMGNSYYFYGNYTDEYAAKKDGWFVVFLKMLVIEKEFFGK